MARFTTRPEILGTFGVVTSTHWLATAAGMAILERGGNAFDAAVATGFALQVVEPHLNGPGGEVPLIVATPDGKVSVICGQGVAPAAATIEAYTDLGLDMVPGTGLLATVVPGAFDAWMLLLRDFGTLELREVMETAIGYARDGYPMVPLVSAMISNMAPWFEAHWPTSAATYLPGGAVPQAGKIFGNSVLADTYDRLLVEAEARGGNRESRIEAAREVWRQGFVAESIDRFCRDNEFMDSSGRAHRGLLTGADLAAWEATVEAPLCFDYQGFTLCKTGPWGQGPVALQQLALLDHFDLSGLDEGDPEFVHTVVECAKLAFADREAFYGDPDFVEVPMAELLERDYNLARAGLVTDQASLEIRPGSIAGQRGNVIVPEASEAGEDGGGIGAGEPTLAAMGAGSANSPGLVRGDTCHFDIIDRWGNMISGTPSGGWLQGSPDIPELGFCLNARAQMFWLDASSPAALAPGSRPRTTLSPGLALRDGEPYLAFGTPGGDQQDQWALHVFLRHVHFGLNLQEAIDAPAFHSTHFPSSFYPRQADLGHVVLEGRFAPAALDELRRRGHRLTVGEDWSLGRVTAAARWQGVLKAAANPRFMQNYAIGR